VGIDNLVHFIVTCLKHPADANETFLVSDGEDLSTPDLIRRMARSFAQKEFGRGLLMDRLEELLHEAANI
jgi:nucleoside-diphosphate-sugar epimerase